MAGEIQTFKMGVYSRKLDEQPEISLSHGPTDSPIRKRTLFGPSLVPNVTGFSQAILPMGSSVERHVHESKYETFFCLKGKGKFVVGKTEETSDEDVELDLEPGSCITVAPQYWHSVHNVADDEGLIMLYFGVACPPSI
ncbi:hypothetical protein P5673_009997 [Acropora cervicornis]|uniref:Cupin type-2 domain-containing protein n=1 Tax=Acropora cervicornis TaxID=6130 RepID=A0AAD9QSA6_ACRCE|nr:hypothetical protein P5673_009997 [Acropora cervicornis]